MSAARRSGGSARGRGGRSATRARAEPGEARGGGPKRRALSQRGGAIEGAGAEPEVSQLTAALAASDGAGAHDLTHGFHSYAARMHPRLARELIAAFAQAGQVVVDPFCGSGTVLIEALVAGCRPIGVDVNPFALRIAALQSELRRRDERARFAATAQAVVEASLERVQTRTRPHTPISRHEQQHYQPHVLLELAGLFEEIQRVAVEADRRALEMVFSALLVKFSRQRADTSEYQVDKRIRKGLVSEFFARKASELVLRWEALAESAPPDAAAVHLYDGDARRLPELLPQRTAADLVLCSPPYGGTYDYAQQHARRNAWFGIDPRRWEASEIGARRHQTAHSRARERWDDELGAFLNSARASLAPHGRIILWLGDAEFAGRRVPADDQVARLAPQAGLEPIARATQQREDARGGPPRGEHLLLLAPAPR